MNRLPIDTPENFDDLGRYADLRNGDLMRLPRSRWPAVVLIALVAVAAVVLMGVV